MLNYQRVSTMGRDWTARDLRHWTLTSAVLEREVGLQVMIWASRSSRSSHSSRSSTWCPFLTVKSIFFSLSNHVFFFMVKSTFSMLIWWQQVTASTLKLRIRGSNRQGFRLQGPGEDQCFPFEKKTRRMKTQNDPKETFILQKWKVIIYSDYVYWIIWKALKGQRQHSSKTNPNNSLACWKQQTSCSQNGLKGTLTKFSPDFWGKTRLDQQPMDRSIYLLPNIKYGL